MLHIKRIQGLVKRPQREPEEGTVDIDRVRVSQCRDIPDTGIDGGVDILCVSARWAVYEVALQA